MLELLDKCDVRAQHQRVLQHWTERMQAYASENADLTGTNRNRVASHGLPVVTLEMFNLLCFVAKRAPMLELIEACGFWDGRSASTSPLRRSLSRLSISMGE